jgi:RNA polymerase sigma-70 factor, ECF subfamily
LPSFFLAHAFPWKYHCRRCLLATFGKSGKISDFCRRPAGLALEEGPIIVPANPDTEQLIDQASRGDTAAREQLLVRHRDRLRKMVRVRMDRRLAARIDPSDVVQEALADADRKLSDYLRRRPLPFYPWLRRLAWERLIILHRRHVRAGRRSVVREEPANLALPDESSLELAQRLIAPGTGPSNHLLRQEAADRVQAALAQLGEGDREVLVLRYLEGLSNPDIAAALGVSEGAVKMRHLRALERLRGLLADELGGDQR